MSGKLLLRGGLAPVLISIATGFALAVMILPPWAIIVIAAIGSFGATRVHSVLVEWADHPIHTSWLRARAPAGLSDRVVVYSGLVLVAFFGTLVFFGSVALPAYVVFAALAALARFAAHTLDNGSHSALLNPAPPASSTRRMEYGRRLDTDPQQ